MGAIVLFEYKKEYDTGVHEIDVEHRKFFAYINTAVDALEMPPDAAIRTANQILDVMVKYADEHFGNEEAYMRSIGSPELKRQQMAHARFKDAVGMMIKKRDEMSLSDLGTIFVFMSKWLKEHILIEDRRIGKPTHRMMMTSEFLTGIDVIDEEHARLFDLVAEFKETMSSRVLDELRSYAARHFADEERYMESVGYEGLDEQRAEHSRFIDRVDSIDLHAISGDIEGQEEASTDIAGSLTDWLVSHILKLDKRIPVPQEKM